MRERQADRRFVALGIATPLIVWAITGAIVNQISSTGNAYSMTLAQSLLAPLPLLLLFVQVVAFFMGKHLGNERLRSWGLGGMLLAGVGTLLGLLVFGACLIVARGYGG